MCVSVTEDEAYSRVVSRFLSDDITVKSLLAAISDRKTNKAEAVVAAQLTAELAKAGKLSLMPKLIKATLHILFILLVHQINTENDDK